MPTTPPPRQQRKTGPTKAPCSLPEPIQFSEFAKQNIDKPVTIIDNMLDSESLFVIGGGSKTYKTWCLSDIALSITAGVPFWNFQTHKAPILYANFELKEYYAQQRFKAICDVKGITYPENLYLWNLRGRNIGECRNLFRDKAIEQIKQHGCIGMMIDPFYKLLGDNDERISAEIVPVFNVIDEIMTETKVSVLTANHYTKGNQADKDPIDRVAGGAIIGRHTDGVLTLTKHETDGSFSVEMIVRDFNPIPNFVVSWRYPLLVPNPGLKAEDLKRPKARGARFTPEAFVSVLAQPENDDQYNTEELCTVMTSKKKGIGCSRGTFFNLLSVCETRKMIFRSKLTDKWNVSQNYKK